MVLDIKKRFVTETNNTFMISSKSIDYSSLPTIDLLFDPNQLFYHFGMVFVANCHWIQCENVLATVTLPAHHIRKTLLHARPVISPRRCGFF